MLDAAERRRERPWEVQKPTEQRGAVERVVVKVNSGCGGRGEGEEEEPGGGGRERGESLKLGRRSGGGGALKGSSTLATYIDIL